MSPQADSSMPSYTLNCRMNQEAAALERLCRVVRVRGFRISRMTMESAGAHLDIALTLEGSRSVSMLQSQLEKLHTVAEVAVVQSAGVRAVS
ncbi:ACT domain-containing protein [Marinobacter sp.]|uniref:ACT domain-containing protein n=1 Tax=Marinobacter sp. TaxID=50741 RepID=UPI0019F4C1DE|nr:ACT domain-containing protein [Marinobacter sp.]